MKPNLRFFPISVFAMCALFLGGCKNAQNASDSSKPTTNSTKTNAPESNEVVVYCSVDEVYARPILNQIQAQTGLRVRPLFDVEAAKTAGLATRLRTEKNRPRADIFWSSATLQTLLLARDGVLIEYSKSSPNRANFSENANDKSVNSSTKTSQQRENAQHENANGEDASSSSESAVVNDGKTSDQNRNAAPKNANSSENAATNDANASASSGENTSAKNANSSDEIAAAFRVGGGIWAPTGERARLIVYNASVKNPPRSLDDLLSPRFRGKVAISNPLFGTGSDWVSALTTRWGAPKTLEYFRKLKANGAQIVPGNSVVAERVARGEALVGVTDSDDFLAMQKQIPALRASTNLDARGQTQVVVVPMSVAITRGAPHANAARRFADALLKSSTQTLIETKMPGVYSPQSKATTPNSSAEIVRRFTVENIARAPKDTAKWADSWDKIREPLADILLRD